MFIRFSAVFFFIATSSLLSAQLDFVDRSMICPVDGESVSALVRNAPASKEQDRDLFRLYPGIDFYGKGITVCPSCGYAVYTNRFEMPVTEMVKLRIRKDLTPTTLRHLAGVKARYKAMGVALVQDDIPGLFKYENAEKTFEILNLDNVVRGKLALEATWYCRQLLVNPPPSPITNEYMVAMNKKVNSIVGIRHLKDSEEWMGVYRQALGKSSARVKYCIYMVLAGLSDRLGNEDTTQKYLESALALAWEGRLKNLVQYHLRLLKVAHTYREKAITLFIDALESKKVRSDETALLTYLTGELLRRNSEPGRAKYWLKAVKQIPGAPKSIVEWAKGQYALSNERTQPSVRDQKAMELILENQKGSAEVSVGLDKVKLRMRLLRAAILLFKVDTGLWPENLKSLITLGYIKEDEETHCPITGEVYVYFKPSANTPMVTVPGEKSPLMLSSSKLYPVLYGVRSHKMLLNGAFKAD